MRPKVFMVMPFMNSVANDNYELSIKPACELFNLEIRRADEIFSTKPVYEDIVKEIQDASIIIVDITSKNANVFYELGMAHTLKQSRTIMVTQDKFEETPFDISHFRIIPYENTIIGKVNFETKLKSTIRTLLEDYKESFKDEFELTLNIFLSGGEQYQLIGLVGLQNYKGILNTNQRYEVEGECGGVQTSHSSFNLGDSYIAMKKLAYIICQNNIILLTEKGKAFVEFLIENGIKCYKFNEQIFVDNYVSLWERASK